VLWAGLPLLKSTYSNSLDWMYRSYSTLYYTCHKCIHHSIIHKISATLLYACVYILYINIKTENLCTGVVSLYNICRHLLPYIGTYTAIIRGKSIAGRPSRARGVWPQKRRNGTTRNREYIRIFKHTQNIHLPTYTTHT